MKKLFALFLVMCLLLAMIPPVYAVEQTSGSVFTIEMDEPYVYYGDVSYSQLRPVIKDGDKVLKEGTHYQLSYSGWNSARPDVKVTVTGMGEYAGRKTSFSYAILKKDVADKDISIWVKNNDEQRYFLGMPCMPEIQVYTGGNTFFDIYSAKDAYVMAVENNVNVGDAVVRIYGTENYTGMAKDTFDIRMGDTQVALQGAYNGVAGGKLNDEVYYAEYYMSPGKLTARINEVSYHAAYYALYRLDGEEYKLIKELETEFGNQSQTAFSYDFSSVYNSASDIGGEVYMLAYSWVDGQDYVYSGALVLLVPAKVPQGTSMQVEKMPNVGNFRTQYLTYYSEDGALELPKWTSSDTSVATVEDGTVTFKKPGTVTVTAKSGKLSDSITLTAPVQDLGNGSLFGYTAANGKAYVYYDGYLLEEGVDYTTEVRTEGGIAKVTVTGKNLFSGKLEREFDPSGHNHNFDSPCDPTCDECGYTRDAGHTMSAQWMKDKTHHWHSCTVCKEVQDKTPHTVTAEEPDVCTVCGELSPAGDLDGNAMTNENDAIYLLQHVLMPDDFPVDQPVDFDSDGKLSTGDVIYLLQYILMPDLFPLH